jgi:hypothetical protein
LFVRVLAVLYVLCPVVQWMGFLVLAGTAAFLHGRRRQLDGLVLLLGSGGLAWFLLCAAYRWWFPRWGRKRYPPAPDEGQTAHR